MDKIIGLSVIDDHLHELFFKFASKEIHLLRDNPYIFYNLNGSLQNTSRRALRVLSDSKNSEIGNLLGYIFSNDLGGETKDSLLAELAQYYMFAFY